MSALMEGHTVRRFDGELSNLHLLTVEMGGLALTQVQEALEAMADKDPRQARAVMGQDRLLNRLESKIDDEIVHLLARRTPVARDLRTVMAMSKVVTDLERIGDEAARIASLAIHMLNTERPEPGGHLLRDVHSMGRLAMGILRDALGVLDTLDVERAHTIAQCSTELDIEFQSGVRRLATYIMEDPRNFGHAISVVLMIKALERIGEHARNVAEYVVYMIEGKDIRHIHAEENDEMAFGRDANGKSGEAE